METRPPDNFDYFALAKKRRDQAQSYWKDIYADFDTDMRLVAGDQWRTSDRAAREQAGRPALQFNRQAQNVQMLVNMIRQNKPAIRVNPKSDSTVEEAKYFQGIIRHIEYASQADMCRENAAEYSIGGGFGFYRITTEYASDDSFDLDIFIRRIADPKTVLFDPNVMQPDFSDARWCQVWEYMSWDVYKQKYPNSDHASWDPVMRTEWGDWADEDGIWLCEYWQVETKYRTLLMLRDGTSIFDDELQTPVPESFVVRRRQIEKRTVKCDLINAVEILASTVWAGDWIPIMVVLGKELFVEGKRKFISLVRNNRDTQQLLNAAYSGVAENIGLTNRVPYIGYKGSFKSDKNWAQAHVTNPAFLEFDPVYGENGELLPPPQRQTAEAAIGALSQLAGMMIDSNKAGAGMFDSSLGAAEPEYSGISVQRRVRQADLTNLHFSDNLSRTMWHEGRCLIQLIQRVIDRPRAMRIMGEDGVPDTIPVTMNVPLSDGSTMIPQVPGFEGKQHLKIDKGNYDVVVMSGPSYPTRKIEEFEAWSEMGRSNPLIWQAAGDQIIKNAPFEGAEVISESYLTMMPPAIQELRKAKNGQAPIPPEVQAQIAQMQAQLQQLQVENTKLILEKEGRVLELQSDQENNMRDNKTKLEIEAIKHSLASSQTLLQQEVAAIKHQMELMARASDAQQQKLANPQAMLGGM
jgi:hypothetical protein